MRKTILSICLLLFILPAYADVDVESVLERIFSKYEFTKQDRSEERLKLLIELDRDIRKLIDKPWTTQRKMIAQKYWKEKYLDIGVFIGHYSDALSYSGKLLKEAKALDTGSKYAPFTRYSDICHGAGSFSGGCDMPNIKAALDYEKEFPQGPFIEDALTIIGNFYSDLRQALKIMDTVDYKFECFSKYINKKPVQAQITDAKKTAVKYYKKVLALHSSNTITNDAIKEWLNELNSNEDNMGWHFCTD